VSGPPITDELLAKARALRAEGLSWYATAKHLGFDTAEPIRSHLDPVFAQRRRTRAKQSKRRTITAVSSKVSIEAFGRAYLKEAGAPEPRLRRVLVQRGVGSSEVASLGDPGPGRSALDQRRHQGAPS
jgi:hypothetical protein